MIKLHLGCGWRNFGEDWVHIDGGNYPHVISHNIINLPYEDNSVDLIYSSHVIQYFDREEVVPVLKEWNRVLKPRGLLRIAVPDFEAITNLYVNGRFPLKNFLGLLYGKMEMGMKGGETGKIIYHKTVYDFLSLREVLESVGFSDIRRYDWRTTPPHNKFDDQSQAYLPHMDKENGTLVSLNVEANKSQSR
ncbi:MAG: methyltransferase domain-containing protein [Candidatus Pacearchaeota archaeon]